MTLFQEIMGKEKHSRSITVCFMKAKLEHKIRLGSL